jgi:hypothetical protein
LRDGKKYPGQVLRATPRCIPPTRAFNGCGYCCLLSAFLGQIGCLGQVGCVSPILSRNLTCAVAVLYVVVTTVMCSSARSAALWLSFAAVVRLRCHMRVAFRCRTARQLQLCLLQLCTLCIRLLQDVLLGLASLCWYSILSAPSC